MPDPTYTVEMELTANSFTNVTSDVVRFNIERKLSDLFHPLAPSNATVQFLNDGGKFSPQNSSSPYYPNLISQKKLRIKATHGTSLYPLFLGWIDEYQINPDPADRTTVVEARDSITRFDASTVTTSFFANTNPASFFTVVMSQSLVNSFAADSIFDTIAFAWTRDISARSVVQDILDFGYYKLFQDGAGTVQLKNRYYTLGELSSVASLTEFFGFNYLQNENQIINLAKLSGQPRKISTTTNTVAWLQEIISIQASSATGFWLTYVDPVEVTVPTPATSLVTPLSSADYRANTSSDGSGTDRTSTTSPSVTFFGETAVCSLFNGSADTIYLTKFQLRGNSAQLQPSLSYETKDTSSQNVYGKHAFFQTNNYWSERNFIKDYADELILERKEEIPQLSITLKNDFTPIFVAELGSALSVQEPLTGVDSKWSIVSLTHDVTLQSGLEHTLRVDLDYLIDRPWLILDHLTKGKLDSGRVLAF